MIAAIRSRWERFESDHPYTAMALMFAGEIIGSLSVFATPVLLLFIAWAAQ